MGTLRERLDGMVKISESAFELCVADDDDLDALVSALTASGAGRALRSGPPGMGWAAVREGWIHLPEVGSLSLLARSFGDSESRDHALEEDRESLVERVEVGASERLDREAVHERPADLH